MIFFQPVQSKPPRNESPTREACRLCDLCPLCLILKLKYWLGRQRKHLLNRSKRAMLGPSAAIETALSTASAPRKNRKRKKEVVNGLFLVVKGVQIFNGKRFFHLPERSRNTRHLKWIIT